MISALILPADRSPGYPCPMALNSLEVTGRATTHVRDVAGLNCVLHVRTAGALIAMRNEARLAGIELNVVSAFRDFNRQIVIWAGKFNGQRPLLDRAGKALDRKKLDESALIEAILIWSALPGASRHHWGTEIDVIDAAATAGEPPQLLPAEFAVGGCFERLNGWLDSNMGRFGFFRPYATDRGGVQPEPWHLSYAEISTSALQVLTLDVLREALEGAEMPGREAVLARLPELYQRYVLAIDPP
jgi:D-alanyl-D-alanine carboxypeptidase